MDQRLAAFGAYLREADSLFARVFSRDGLHFSPERISQAAAARLRAGLKLLTAYLARLITLMALAIEPELTYRETDERRPRERSCRPRFSLRLFAPDRPFNTSGLAALGERTPPSHSDGSVPATPLLIRLAHLRALIENPLPRARARAFHLARRLPGLLLAPKPGVIIGPRWGTGPSALHSAMGPAILNASRERPPPLPPPKPARPTITLL